MRKIAIIGAGSFVFTQVFLNDLLATPTLDGTVYALMGPTRSKLETVEAYANRVIQKNGLRSQVYSTTNRQEALKDASFVITILNIGGSTAGRLDKEIPKKYGVDQLIGDTLGPGGILRAQRTIPIMVDIAKDMERLCPNALLLNYVNPMSMVCLALGSASSINFVGLCHGVQTTSELLARYVGISKEEMDFVCAGINHMAWFLRIEKDGRDLYPTLRENIEKSEYYISEKVRCETMRHFGYFMTESSDHLSEYLPWFRKSRQTLDLYCDRPAFKMLADQEEAEKNNQIEGQKIDYLKDEDGTLTPRSSEYCSYIIEALESEKIFKFNGNVMNNGHITNLPMDSCVEVPIFADKTGLHPAGVGRLPLQLAALNQSNITVHQLAVEAALKGDTELLFAAAANDPLTSAVLTLQETRDMVNELLEAQKEFLPQYHGKSLKKTYSVSIPEGTVGVEVPLDPALAVAARIDKMIKGR